MVVILNQSNVSNYTICLAILVAILLIVSVALNIQNDYLNNNLDDKDLNIVGLTKQVGDFNNALITVVADSAIQINNLNTQLTTASTQLTAVSSERDRIYSALVTTQTEYNILSTDNNTLKLDNNVLRFDNNFLVFDRNILIARDSNIMVDMNNRGHLLYDSFDNCYLAVKCVDNNAFCATKYSYDINTPVGAAQLALQVLMLRNSCMAITDANIGDYNYFA